MWRVEHQCPQCGGTVDLEEAQRFFVCPFCRVKLLMTTDDCFRYVLPPAPGASGVFFAPYRRFKGMYFSYAGHVSWGLVDVSRNVSPLPMLPASLGLRPETQKLKFVSPSAESIFLEAISGLNDVVPESAAPPSDRVYIGETSSLIYAPFFTKDRAVWDGILRERIAAIPEDLTASISTRTRTTDAHLRFLPALCPDCGWDLEGNPVSVVLYCRNCSSVWNAADSGLQKVPCSHIPLQQDHSQYLPFWRIEAEMEDMVRSHADAVRILNLPAAVQPDWERIPFRWLVPAFRINPERFLAISRSMSLSRLEGEEAETLPRGTLQAVTLPLAEAFESLRITFAYSALSKSDMALLYPRLKPVLKKADLVFRPFMVSGMELIRPDRQLSINANALKWGTNI